LSTLSQTSLQSKAIFSDTDGWMPGIRLSGFHVLTNNDREKRVVAEGQTTIYSFYFDEGRAGRGEENPE